VENLKDETLGKAGRPKKEIDWDQVKKLCYIQCTQGEIADILRVHVQTLDAACQRDHSIEFSTYYKMHTSEGKASLRRTMYKTAMRGNPAMQIWLSKNYLGMKENWNLPENIAPIVLSYKTPNKELTEQQNGSAVIDISADERIDHAPQERNWEENDQ
jgi:hypothetical protein